VSVSTRVGSDDQLARLLQIGIVLEEVVEARAQRHYQSLVDEGGDPDPELAALLREAATESAGHRERLDALVGALDAESVPFGEVETLVAERYARTEPEDFDGVLYDQLCNEETAYKFYDDLIEAIEASEAEFSLDRERLLSELRALREEEAEGVERVADLMDREDVTEENGRRPGDRVGTEGEGSSDGERTPGRDDESDGATDVDPETTDGTDTEER
jgi:rubrerythrin